MSNFLDNWWCQRKVLAKKTDCGQKLKNWSSDLWSNSYKKNWEPPPPLPSRKKPSKKFSDQKSFRAEKFPSQISYRPGSGLDQKIYRPGCVLDQKSYSDQSVSEGFETFRCFTIFSFHHKWNDGRFLLINMVYTSFLTSCRTT